MVVEQEAQKNLGLPTAPSSWTAGGIVSRRQCRASDDPERLEAHLGVTIEGGVAAAALTTSDR